MLNTNLPKIELREKELLLERRHSICLEISKKRRQSVATSIFIPKNCLKTISKSNGSQKPALRNKKFLTSMINKKRNYGRILVKKKLKRLTISNKNKGLGKLQTSLSLLKHPDSYPIVKQSVSSEKIRHVVESLRDKEMAQNSTISANKIISKPRFKKETFETDDFEFEQNKIEDTQKDFENEIDSCESSLNGLIRTFTRSEVINDSPKVDESSYITAESELSGVDNKVLSPHTLYSSINRVANFLIMIDSSGSNVEIKYDGHPTPSSTENCTLQNFSESNEYTSRYCTSFEKIKEEYPEIGYNEKDNCITTMNTKMLVAQPSYVFSSNESVNHIEEFSKNPCIATDDALHSNLTQSIQDIIDLSVKERTESVVNEPSKLNNPIIHGTPPTTHRPETALLPNQQTRQPCHRKLICTKTNYNTSIFPSCCYINNTTVRPKLVAQPHETQFTAINRPTRLQSYHYINQSTAYLETPPISPRDQQYIPMPSTVNFPIYDLHHNLQSCSIPETLQTYNDSPANLIPNGLNCSSYTNKMYPLDQHSSQLPHRLDYARHRQSLDLHNSCFSYSDHLRQIPENHQTNLHRQRPISQEQYHNRQPNQINYNTYQPFQASQYHHPDLPRQFYHPLYQSLFSCPNNFTTMSTVPTSTNGDDIFGAWRFRKSPVIIPPHRSVRSTQNYHPSTPSTHDGNFSSEQLMVMNRPFPSPNWTNTLNNCPTLPIRAPSHLNIQPPTYSLRPRLHSHTTSLANTSNPIADSAHSSPWPPTYIHTQAPSNFGLNYNVI